MFAVNVYEYANRLSYRVITRNLDPFLRLLWLFELSLTEQCSRLKL